MEQLDFDFYGTQDEEVATTEVPPAVYVHFRTQEGTVGTVGAEYAATELYAEEMVQVLMQLYEEIGFVNDLKITLNYRDPARKQVFKYRTEEL